MNRPTSLLILGLGNLLCGDDGVGAAAVNLLSRKYDAPAGVQVLDGGTLGLSLLPYIEDAREVILVDAIRIEAAPGSFVRLEGDDVPDAVLHRLSPHQVGVADLLDGARWLDHYPERVILLGLVPETLDLGLQRSPAVSKGLPVLVERIVDEGRRLGYEFERKGEGEPDSGVEPVALARLFGL